MNKNPSPAEIKALRESSGLTQNGLAALLKVTRRGIQKWEYAESPMPGGYWELMRIKVAALKGGRNDRTNPRQIS